MTITSLNLYVLGKLAKALEKGPIDSIAPTDMPHLRRCIRAGLLRVDPSKRESGGLVLTNDGRAALAARQDGR